MTHELPILLQKIKACKICESNLSHGANPVLTAAQNSKIVVIGQAPGMKVHLSRQPWADKSGERLIEWLGIDRETLRRRAWRLG